MSFLFENLMRESVGHKSCFVWFYLASYCIIEERKSMTKLFKNAKLVDIENGTVVETDILVEAGKIKSFGKVKSFDGEVVDLAGGYVLPSFVNSFMDSVGAVKCNFEALEGKLKNEAYLRNVRDLFLVKNLLAGACFFNDVNITKVPVIDGLEEMNEKQLSDLSMAIAKSKIRPFLKLGQDLQSLGSVDKMFGKSAVMLLEDFGFLDRKPVVVGGNCLEKDDLEVLANYETDFVVLPNEDGRVGRRQTNLISLFSKGFNVALGSGLSAEIDFFGFMRELISNTRAMFEDVKIISEKDALKIATSGSILGFENTLKLGGFATFIVVDGRESLYDDVLKTLVWERSKKDVLMCVRDGEVLQKNGEIFMKSVPDYDTIIVNLKQ